MSTAATMSSTPAVPPRPNKSADQDASTGSAMPVVPPRPARAANRSVSPNPDRFAPSPFTEGLIQSPTKSSARLSPFRGDPVERPGSVSLPSIGQEGSEYEQLAEQADQLAKRRSLSPEQTRTIGEEVKLHAPKPSLPVGSAQERVQAVTRTDSDKAAQYGFGRPNSRHEDRAPSRQGMKKKASSSFSGYSDHGHDDEHGIPEFGQRVPMNPNLGDVQAPSPDPESAGNHHRKRSSRSIPPGSYGLHGHGVAPQDKFEKAYYQKHPDVLERENQNALHERQHDYAMSSEDLNKLVHSHRHETYSPIPSDEAAFAATEQFATRVVSPQPSSASQKEHMASPLRKSFSQDDQPIHVADRGHPEYRSCGDADPGEDDENHDYNAPILATDEVEKDPQAYMRRPAVPPRGHSFDKDSQHRPTSRPSSLYQTVSNENHVPTPLDDVEEYEPLFKDEEEKKKEEQKKAAAAGHHFPSKDIWEDAPSSVHYTATVSTPELPEHQRKPSAADENRAETPAQAFARRQEELAEKEARIHDRPEEWKIRDEEKPTYVDHQAHLQRMSRPSTSSSSRSNGHKFPSKDVWEDTPESLLHQTTVSSSPPSESSKPEAPPRPAKKMSGSSADRPAVPERPKPKQTPSDDAKTRPPVAANKPQIPARPAKPAGDGESTAAAKVRPPVPARVGNKIAALQSGFLEGLNQRLKIGPQGNVKKDQPSEEDQSAATEQEKPPLSDARKGRARGPQRRAPAKSPAPAQEETKKLDIPTFTFTMVGQSWGIDPQVGDLSVGEASDAGEEKVPPRESPVEALPSEPAADNVKTEEPQESETVKAEPQAETEFVGAEQPAPIADSSEPEPQATEEPVEPAPPTSADVKAAKVEGAENGVEGSVIGDPTKPAEEHREVEVEDSAHTQEPRQEGKKEQTLVSNTAGESILEAVVEPSGDGKSVQPLDVDDKPKDLA